MTALMALCRKLERMFLSTIDKAMLIMQQNATLDVHVSLNTIFLTNISIIYLILTDDYGFLRKQKSNAWLKFCQQCNTLYIYIGHTWLKANW